MPRIERGTTEKSCSQRPSLEAKKPLFSLVATEGVGCEEGKWEHAMKEDYINKREAFFHAEARRDVYYVEMPSEDLSVGKVVTLKKSS